MRKTCKNCGKEIIGDWKKWIEENPESRYIQCPYCYEMEEIRNDNQNTFREPNCRMYCLLLWGMDVFRSVEDINMIKLITEEDMKWFATKINELIDRTKRQTKQIQELNKRLKQLEKGK